jgi:hypothetical protein
MRTPKKTGISGRIHGEKKESNPPKKALPYVTLVVTMGLINGERPIVPVATEVNSFIVPLPGIL